MSQPTLTLQAIVEAYRAADADLPESLLSLARGGLGGDWACEILADKGDLPPHWHRRRYVATTAGLAALHQMPLRVARKCMTSGGMVWQDSKTLKVAGRWVATWVKPCPDAGHTPTFSEVLEAVMDRAIRETLNQEVVMLGAPKRWGASEIIVPVRVQR